MKNVKLHIPHDLLRITYYVLVILHSSFFILHSSFSCAQQPPLTIAIIQPHDVTAYQEAVDGFLKQLRRSLKQEINPIIYESPQGLYTSVQQANKTMMTASQIALILTVGTEATAEIAQTMTKIPIVFTMVLDPENILNQREDIVGASLNIPPEFQLNMIKEVLPDAHHIGVLYDPNKHPNFIAEHTPVMEKFNLTFNPFPVSSPKDIPKALEQVRQKADVLWGIVDNTVYTSKTTEFIIRYTIKEKIPFIGLSASYVKAGALCALVFDNKDIGRQAAELAGRLLSGTSVSELQTSVPEKIGLAINRRTAEIIGVKIPQNMLEKAVIVYE
jgi:putative ABC transport system substrate-binding protein